MTNHCILFKKEASSLGSKYEDIGIILVRIPFTLRCFWMYLNKQDLRLQRVQNDLSCDYRSFSWQK